MAAVKAVRSMGAALLDARRCPPLSTESVGTIAEAATALAEVREAQEPPVNRGHRPETPHQVGSPAPVTAPAPPTTESDAAHLTWQLRRGLLAGRRVPWLVIANEAVCCNLICSAAVVQDAADAPVSSSGSADALGGVLDDVLRGGISASDSTATSGPPAVTVAECCQFLSIVRGREPIKHRVVAPTQPTVEARPKPGPPRPGLGVPPRPGLGVPLNPVEPRRPVPEGQAQLLALLLPRSVASERDPPDVDDTTTSRRDTHHGYPRFSGSPYKNARIVFGVWRPSLKWSEHLSRQTAPVGRIADEICVDRGALRNFLVDLPHSLLAEPPLKSRLHLGDRVILKTTSELYRNQSATFPKTSPLAAVCGVATALAVDAGGHVVVVHSTEGAPVYVSETPCASVKAAYEAFQRSASHSGSLAVPGAIIAGNGVTEGDLGNPHGEALQHTSPEQLAADDGWRDTVSAAANAVREALLFAGAECVASTGGLSVLALVFATAIRTRQTTKSRHMKVA